VALPANEAYVATWADPYLISPWATKYLPIDVNKAERPLEDLFNGPSFFEKHHTSHS
jgi:hypothetical protein